MLVTVVSPTGDIDSVVRCRDGVQCLEVVETVSEDAPLWTVMSVTRQSRGGTRPVARWGVGPDGLVRVPYRRRAS